MIAAQHGPPGGGARPVRVRYAPGMPDPAEPRRILTAELLSIGSELTVGDTRDTNAGELARALTGLGVEVRRMTALQDRLDAVRDAFADGLGRADLVDLDGRPRPHPRRPDARGDRGRVRRDAGYRPRARDVAAPAVAAARDAVPRGQPQTGVAHPVGRGPAEPERHRTRLVRPPAGRSPDRRPARTAARDAPDVGGRGDPAPRTARSRRGRGHPDLSAGRDRRVHGRGPAR